MNNLIIKKFVDDFRLLQDNGIIAFNALISYLQNNIVQTITSEVQIIIWQLHLAIYAKKGENLSMLCLDFTTTQEVIGFKQEIELVKNGANIEVNNYNFPEYLEAQLKYRMLDRVNLLRQQPKIF